LTTTKKLKVAKSPTSQSMYRLFIAETEVSSSVFDSAGQGDRTVAVPPTQRTDDNFW
jgi:hypothetical protein